MTPSPSPRTIAVTVMGPNLRTQTETMHIHAAGCQDLRKPLYRNQNGGWTIDAESWVDIVTTIYDPHDFDYDPTDPTDLAGYEDDIKLFPCVKGLARSKLT